MSNEQTKTETKAIQHRDPLPLEPTTANQAWEMARWLGSSNLIPEVYRGKPENIFAAMMMGRDLGISTMQAMRGIYVVHGTPAASAMLLVGLVRSSGECLYWRLIESNDQQTTIETKRRGDPEPTKYTYTRKDAEQAGLLPAKGDSNWAKRPRTMMRHRCESELARTVYPDIVQGLYTEDEAADIAPKDMGTAQRVDLSGVQPITATLPAATRIPEVVEPPAEPAKVETQPASEAKKVRITDESTTPDPAPAVWTDADEDKLSQWENSSEPMSKAVYDALLKSARALPQGAERAAIGGRVVALKPRVVNQSADVLEPGSRG